jgi:hypothetical protein
MPNTRRSDSSNRHIPGSSPAFAARVSLCQTHSSAPPGAVRQRQNSTGRRIRRKDAVDNARWLSLQGRTAVRSRAKSRARCRIPLRSNRRLKFSRSARFTIIAHLHCRGLRSAGSEWRRPPSVRHQAGASVPRGRLCRDRFHHVWRRGSALKRNPRCRSATAHRLGFWVRNSAGPSTLRAPLYTIPPTLSSEDVNLVPH